MLEYNYQLKNEPEEQNLQQNLVIKNLLLIAHQSNLSTNDQIQVRLPLQFFIAKYLKVMNFDHYKANDKSVSLILVHAMPDFCHQQKLQGYKNSP